MDDTSLAEAESSLIKFPVDDKKKCEKVKSTEKILELTSFNFKPCRLASLNLTHQEIETRNPGEVRI